MSDFTVRSDSINVEQIMDQIRARIREKRGVDYTEQQIHEMAAVKLEKFLDPRGVRSDLLDQYKRARPAYQPPELPNYAFEEETLFESHRGPLRLMRRLLRPILKLFFNPNPLIQALNIQARLNASFAEREAKREADRHAFDQLYYEVVHNLVTETTRLSIEVKNLKMRVESLTSRLEFNERRARALESVVVYRDASEGSADVPKRAVPVDAPIHGHGEIGAAGEPARAAAPGAPAEGPGQRSRRRRRRRGRRGTGSVAALMGTPGAPASAAPPVDFVGSALESTPSSAELIDDRVVDHGDSPEPDAGANGESDSDEAGPSDQEQ
jgi:hypothetical protein